MAKTTIPVDVSKAPDLLRLAEEVHASKTPRVLRRGDKDLAVIMPVAPRRRLPRTPTGADLDALLASAGSWSDLIDLEQFKHQIAESRGSSRLQVDL